MVDKIYAISVSFIFDGDGGLGGGIGQEDECPIYYIG